MCFHDCGGVSQVPVMCGGRARGQRAGAVRRWCKGCAGGSEVHMRVPLMRMCFLGVRIVLCCVGDLWGMFL